MPARAVVYAAANTRIGHEGRRFTLQIDQPWAADDPLVKARPDLFSKQPTEIHTSATAAAVETATAAPGEKRRRG